MTKHERTTEDGHTVPCFYSDYTTLEDRGDTIRCIHYIAGVNGEAGIAQVAISFSRATFQKILLQVIAQELPDLGRPRTKLDS